MLAGVFLTMVLGLFALTFGSLLIVLDPYDFIFSMVSGNTLNYVQDYVSGVSQLGSGLFISAQIPKTEYIDMIQYTLGVDFKLSVKCLIPMFKKGWIGH